MWVESTTTVLQSCRNPVTMRVLASLPTLTCYFLLNSRENQKQRRFENGLEICTKVPKFFTLSSEKEISVFHNVSFIKRLETLVNTLSCSELFSIVNLRVNIGTLVQNEPNQLKSNDFFCTKTCTDLYQNSQICTEMTQLVRPISA